MRNLSLLTSLSLKAVSIHDLPAYEQIQLYQFLGHAEPRVQLSWAASLGYKVPLLPFSAKSGVLCVQGEMTWFIFSIDYISKILKGKTKANCHWLFFFSAKVGRIAITHFISFWLGDLQFPPSCWVKLLYLLASFI